MELPKISLKNTQGNLTNDKNNRFIQPRSVGAERNLYISPSNFNGIPGQFTYQNTLPRLLPEQGFTPPNYYLHNEGNFRGFPGDSGVNCYEIERESAELRRLETKQREPTPNAGEASNAEMNNEKEKENFIDVEQEPKVSKKCF
jgi:hypothetical protein